MVELRVREAVESESESIALLLRLAFVEFIALYTPDGFAATTPTAARIRERWSEGPVWVALDGERVVGTVAVMATPTGLYMRSMAVAPEARGRGVGRALLEQVEGFARAHGQARVYLSTTPFLDEAIRLYQRAGFVRVGEGPKALRGTPLFTMEKRLGPGGLAGR